MNAFAEHHRGSIRFAYSCFDRMVLNAVIQVLQYPSSAAGFLKNRRSVANLTPAYLRSVSTDYHHFVQTFAADQGVEIVEPPKDVRRDEWVEPFFRRCRQGVAVILKSRENARVAISFPKRGNHVELCQRFVWQYYFYLCDRDLGRMFLRICPYFPFNSRVCINQHEWLACRLREEGIRFQQCGNAFRTCSNPERLQELADQFKPSHILASVHRWLAQLVPFFSDHERRRLGFGYRLFASQVEYCTNLIFGRRAALDRMHERLLDLNRSIGTPSKMSMIFGRRIPKHTDAGLKTQIIDHGLGQPAIRSEYKKGSIKQYVRDHLILRTETTSYHTPDLGIRKSIEHLPDLRTKMAGSNERYLDVQQDIMETFVDRGQLEKLRQPTVAPSGRRTPGLKIDDPRLLAILQALTCFAHLAGTGCFRTKDLHATTAKALGQTTDTYTLARLRYDLSKLRVKDLVERVPRKQAYRLRPEGYRLGIFYLKLFHRIYAPLTAGILSPIAADVRLPEQARSLFDRLYVEVDRALDQLCQHAGLKTAS